MEIGQTEEYRANLIAKFVDQVSKHISAISENNMFCLTSVPKYLIDNHFNDRAKIEQLHHQNRQNTILKYGHMPKRKANRFYTELIFRGKTSMASINYFYNGIIIQLMPIDLLHDNKVNASAIYHYIYHFIDLVIAYYKMFNFQAIIDLSFELKGITNKELEFISQDRRSFIDKSFNFDEEIEPQIETIEITDLVIQKVEISKSLVQPLFYGIDFNVTMGLCKENGEPLYYQ